MDKNFGLPKKHAIPKRLFDIFFSFAGLVLFSPIIAIAWVVASIDTRSNGLFVQQRIGLYGKCFNLIKIKTMVEVAGMNTTITSSNDRRITRSGRFLRKTKVDELPQLWNVLVGNMSFVGPRPDVTGYADNLQGEDRLMLSVRPGITGPASLKYRNEEEILAQQVDPAVYNDEVIWPDKVRINREYVKNFSLTREFYFIWKTLFS